MPLIKLNTQSATSLDATKLTGNLPAISGASLTGVESNLVKLQSTTISSAVNDVDFEPSNYTDYKLYLFTFNRIRVSSDNVRFCVRIKIGGSYDTSTEYASATGDGYYSGGVQYSAFTWDNLGNNSSGSDLYEDFHGAIYMGGFEQYRRWRYFGNVGYGDSGSTKRGFDVGGGSNLLGEVQGVRFFGSSGQVNSGQITLYGLST